MVNGNAYIATLAIHIFVGSWGEGLAREGSSTAVIYCDATPYLAMRQLESSHARLQQLASLKRDMSEWTRARDNFVQYSMLSDQLCDSGFIISPLLIHSFL